MRRINKIKNNTTNSENNCISSLLERSKVEILLKRRKITTKIRKMATIFIMPGILLSPFSVA